MKPTVAAVAVAAALSSASFVHALPTLSSPVPVPNPNAPSTQATLSKRMFGSGSESIVRLYNALSPQEAPILNHGMNSDVLGKSSLKDTEWDASTLLKSSARKLEVESLKLPYFLAELKSGIKLGPAHQRSALHSRRAK